MGKIFPKSLEALPGVAYPGFRDNRSTLNTKTGFKKNSPKRGVNRQFQAKAPKSLHRNISGTINPTN